MQPPCDATLLRIVLGDDRIFGHRGVLDQVVHKANAMGLAGATVVRGISGYGPVTRDAIPLGGRPVIIEVIDTESKIREFLPSIRPLIKGSLVTQQKISVLNSEEP